MGLAKIAFNFLVKNAKGELVTSSLLHAKPKMPINIKGLTYSPELKGNIINLSNITKNNIKILKESEVLKSLENYPKILRKTDDKLVQLAKGENITSDQRKELHNVLTTLNEESAAFITSKIGRSAWNLTIADKPLVNKIGKDIFKTEINFLKTFDNALFPKSTNPKAIKIEHELSKMGIDAKLSDHIEEGEILLSACKKMQKLGIKQFPKYRFSVPDKGCGAFAVPNENINEGYVILKDFLQELKTAKQGYFAEKTGEGFIAHETAHILNNHLGIFDNLMRVSWMTDPNAGKKFFDILNKHVSQYASHSPHEAGSEIFAATVEGKIFNDEVMNICKYYKFA